MGEMPWLFIIDRVALAKQGNNRFGSVRLSVRSSVCVSVCVLSVLSCLNRLTYDLDFLPRGQP